MGYGDRLMAIGDALVLHQAGAAKVAVGDGQKVDWDDLCEGLDFLADQAHVEAHPETPWVISHSSNRPYIDYEAMRRCIHRNGHLAAKDLRRKDLPKLLGHYIWNWDYGASPARVAFRPEEQALIDSFSKTPYVVVEPFIKRRAPPNKQWPVERMQQVVDALAETIRVVQVSAPENPAILRHVIKVRPTSFRQAMAYVAGASLYIGPEGGLHHAAAAVGTPAIVLFGGYISPKTTGYEGHVALTGGATRFCGTKRQVCPHCAEAMARITPDRVVAEARRLLGLP